ncbi:heterokaryon incompatibility protein-domain-containing protein [Colletotrichum phormii]|uniref:Heterokaryon incompatibility protein-domain-containing protein n=1 Tax=Colletotrichum phormii TaxID=359342 RepID=A0AAI9ZG37_9PEZI|nr:heterokaryon incompatibility protein-domain-containing protein [Colletotrichum phormii]KAK1622821.1 heterokaryon incompatibility protein-domain-containing protein [Colletotrichum phormii]
MGLTLQVDTENDNVSREENDWLQYQEQAESESDSDSDDDLFDGRLNNPFIRAGSVALNLAKKCDTFFAKVGIRKAEIYRDPQTGNCMTCGGMNEGFFSPIMNIEKGAVAGCPSCSIIKAGVRACLPRQIASSSKISVMESWNSGCAGRQFIRTKRRSATVPGAYGVIVVRSSHLDISNVFVPSTELREDVVAELNFFGTKEEPASWDSIGIAYHISGDTSSDEAFRWFRARLEHCISEHSLCRAADDDGRMPTRVLDLGPFDGLTESEGSQETSDGDIRLHETRDIRLTKDRYHSYTHRITWSSLPQGYRDAIGLTRKLGIRYIWIDSLCIIQDDKDDWRAEAARMASVFQGAHVTISGTKSSSPHQSYFTQSPGKYMAKRVEHCDGEGKRRFTNVRQTVPHFFSSDASGEPNYSPGDFPLLNRGWVFQERLLSPRILHLGDVEMAWECNEETEPRWAHTKGAHARNLSSATEAEELYPDWRSTVENYKKTRLTYQNDILPAIAGVVKNMQRFRKDKYLAGIWEDSLLDDLAWQATQSVLHRPDKWTAPTWSWASVTSQINYSNLRTILASKFLEEPDLKGQRTVVIEASTESAGADPTIEVISGHIALFGPMITARLECDEEEESNGLHRTYYAFHGSTMFEIAPDYDFRAPGKDCVPLGSTIYLLHLCREPELRNKNGTGYKKMPTKVFSLVLRKVADGEGTHADSCPSSKGKVKNDDSSKGPNYGTYERIGILILASDEDGMEDYVVENGRDCVVKLI